MIEPRITANTALWPRNRYFASANPHAVANAAAPTALTTAYSTVLAIHCQKTPPWKMKATRCC